jgi:Fe-S cluster assembly protein SufD
MADAMIESLQQPLQGALGPAVQAGPKWLAELRRRGAEGFAERGLPGGRGDEDWKYTSTRALARTAMAPVLAEEVTFDASAVAACVERIAARAGGPVLVFIDGNFRAEVSRLDAAGDDGVTVASLREVLAGERAAEIEPYLGRYLDARVHGLAALNTALFDDGLVVHTARGRRAAAPISALFWGTSRTTPAANHLRNLIVAEAGAELTVLEHYAGQAGAVYHTNAATEVVVADNAQVAHMRIVEESAGAFHAGRVQAELSRDARLTSHAAALAGGWNRTEIEARLAGAGAECRLDGVYVLAGDEHADHHTWIDHAVADTRSSERYKGVLDDSARGVFTGKVLIRPDAQRSATEQSNRNLLLGDNAVVETRPQLEIYADDVKAAHGATVGRLDAEQLFYLRSRGLDADAAKRVLTFAFAEEPLAGVAHEGLREALAEAVHAKVAGLSTAAARTAHGHTETGDLR